MTVIRGLLARPDVTLVHLRNVGYGCYNFAVRMLARGGVATGCCHGTLPLIRANASPESADPACQRTLRPD